MPSELYVSNDGRYTFFFLKSGIVSGKMHPFGNAFT
jgi:hypothetical protein